MGLTYFRRFRMEIDLTGRDLDWPVVPESYRLLPWDPALLASHAEVKFHSFRDEIDANVFPCFTELPGCQRLMGEIARKPGFLPQTTWLAVYAGPDGAGQECCGTIQGIKDRSGLGAIQNLGITPPHRNRGLGTLLLFRAFRGFQQAGLHRVYLEVTADNKGAIQLYQRLGFQTVKTVFKAAEVSYT
jgi:ribosomal protein S18 acetylase RimI-like enzyme